MMDIFCSFGKVIYKAFFQDFPVDRNPINIFFKDYKYVSCKFWISFEICDIASFTIPDFGSILVIIVRSLYL